MIKTLFYTTLCAVALNAPCFGQDKTIYLEETTWNNTDAKYKFADHIMSVVGTTANAAIEAANIAEEISFSGNSSISFDMAGIPDTCDSITFRFSVLYTDLRFNLSAANVKTPLLDVNLKTLGEGWNNPLYYIEFEGSDIILDGLENLANGKYCLLNISTPASMVIDGELGGISEDSNITIEQSSDGKNYAVYYTHTGGAVPEPATASLSLFGLAALMMRRRRA